MSTRDELLRILENNLGEFVSGAYISDELGVSGTAIWKAIRKLRSEGYVINAVTNRGYQLSADSDVLSAESIYNYMRSMRNSSCSLLPNIEVFQSTDSTNNICRKKAATGEPDGYVAVAANQTAGRGRRGRKFYSPEATGLYLSILLRPSGYSAQEALRFTTMAAVAVCEAIEDISGSKAEIKWVNDIFMDGRKVCGILTEASFDLEGGSLDYAIVGIGINVFVPEKGFPEEIKDTAGAVFNLSDKSVLKSPDIRSRLAASVLDHFMAYAYASCIGSEKPDYISKYRERCFVLGQDIKVLMPGKEPRIAHALDVDNECGLLVRYEDGTEEILRSGEISIRIN